MTFSFRLRFEFNAIQLSTTGTVRCPRAFPESVGALFLLKAARRSFHLNPVNVDAPSRRVPKKQRSIVFI